MDLAKVTAAVDTAASESEPAHASSVFVVYHAPGGALFIHRVGYGTHQLFGDADRDFAESCSECVERLWPEAPERTKRKLHVVAHIVAHSPIAKMLEGAVGAGGTDDKTGG